MNGESELLKKVLNLYVSAKTKPYSEYFMEDPLGFKLLKKFFIAGFKIIGYVFVFIVEIIWYACHRRTEMIGESIGDFGRAVTDAIAEVLK